MSIPVQAAWYKNRSDDFLKARVERKNWALAFIVVFTFIATFLAGRATTGQKQDMLLAVIGAAILAIGCIWYRMAYLSQMELLSRNANGDAESEE